MRSYDGDDNASKAQATSDPGFEPEFQLQAPPPAEVPLAPDPIIQDQAPQDQPIEDHEYGGQIGNGWNDNTANGGTPIMTDHQAEEEQRPIGIKEDG